MNTFRKPISTFVFLIPLVSGWAASPDEVRIAAEQSYHFSLAQAAIVGFNHGMQECFVKSGSQLGKVYAQAVQSVQAFEVQRRAKPAEFLTIDQVNRYTDALRPGYFRAQEHLKLYLEKLTLCAQYFAKITYFLNLSAPLPPQVSDSGNKSRIHQIIETSDQNTRYAQQALEELKDSYVFFFAQGLETERKEQIERVLKNQKNELYQQLIDAVSNHDDALLWVERVSQLRREISAMEKDMTWALERHHLIALPEKIKLLSEHIQEAERRISELPAKLQTRLTTELLGHHLRYAKQRLSLYGTLLKETSVLESFSLVKTQVLERLRVFKTILQKQNIVLPYMDVETTSEITGKLSALLNHPQPSDDQKREALQRLYELDQALTRIQALYF